MTYGDLQDMLASHRVTNFGAREIAPRGLPPSALWSRIIPTLQVAERLRAKHGITYIIVISGYRDPDFNERVGGAPNSLHVSFNALDLVPMKTSTEPVPIQDIIKLLGKDPLWPFMGIGTYSTFVHIDTRGLFTRNARGARWDS